MKTLDMYIEKNQKLMRQMFGVLCVFTFVMLVAGAYFCFQWNLEVLPVSSIMNIAADELGIGMALIVLRTERHSLQILDTAKFIFVVMLFLTTSALFVDQIGWLVQAMPEFITVSWIVNTLYYVLGAAIAWAFFLYIREYTGGSQKGISGISKAFAVITILQMIAMIANRWTGMYFVIDEAGCYQRNPKYYWMVIAFFVASVVVSAYVILATDLSIRKKHVMSTYCVLPVVFIVIQAVAYGLSLQYIGTLSSFLIIYCNVQRDHNIELAQRRIEIAEQNSLLMLSQIQPHFIYNTLGTIKVLCQLNPELAAETIDDFAAYLRGNIDSIRDSRLVHITKEIEHTKNYTKIEELRFDNIHVEYDIAADDFSLPVLTIQPLVENAIRHGVRARDNGVVTVRTAYNKEKKGYEVSIIDNGIGFDPDAEYTGKGNHVGIANVRDRIMHLCHGTFEIYSVLDEGTTVSMFIPKVQDNREQ